MSREGENITKLFSLLVQRKLFILHNDSESVAASSLSKQLTNYTN